MDSQTSSHHQPPSPAPTNTTSLPEHLLRTNVILDGSNYPVWSRRIQSLLDNYDCWNEELNLPVECKTSRCAIIANIDAIHLEMVLDFLNSATNMWNFFSAEYARSEIPERAIRSPSFRIRNRP